MSKLKLLPLFDRVLVERLDAEGRTKGGLIIPETAKEKQAKGRVIEVGPGRFLPSGKRAEPSVKKGDLVLVEKYGGSEVVIDDKEYLMVREEQICGVYQES